MERAESEALRIEHEHELAQAVLGANGRAIQAQTYVHRRGLLAIAPWIPRIEQRQARNSASSCNNKHKAIPMSRQNSRRHTPQEQATALPLSSLADGRGRMRQPSGLTPSQQPASLARADASRALRPE